MAMDQEKIEVAAGTASKSAQIRKMFDSGVAKADIARAVGVRYQYVRNVLVSYEAAKERVAPSAVIRSSDGHYVTRTIELPAEREAFLSSEAAKRGVSADDLLATIIRDFERRLGDQRLTEAFEKIASQHVGNFAVASPANEAQRRAFKELNG